MDVAGSAAFSTTGELLKEVEEASAASKTTSTSYGCCRENLIPGHVTIAVLTQARPELIEGHTAINARGRDLHLYNSTRHAASLVLDGPGRVRNWRAPTMLCP